MPRTVVNLGPEVLSGLPLQEDGFRELSVVTPSVADGPAPAPRVEEEIPRGDFYTSRVTIERVPEATSAAGYVLHAAQG